MWAITDVAILRNMDDDALLLPAAADQLTTAGASTPHFPPSLCSSLLSPFPLDLNVDTANRHWQAINREVQALDYI